MTTVRIPPTLRPAVGGEELARARGVDLRDLRADLLEQFAIAGHPFQTVAARFRATLAPWRAGALSE